MALTGKLVGQVEIKSDIRAFHELYKHKPHKVAAMSSDKIHGCDLIRGQWGAVGSVISWSYTYDGKLKATKEVIEEVDDEHNKIVFKVIEGDFTELYDILILTSQFGKNGSQKLASWTIDFKKANPSVPDPVIVLDLLCATIKDIDAHLQNV